jgi:hypothetical protein
MACVEQFSAISGLVSCTFHWLDVRSISELEILLQFLRIVSGSSGFCDEKLKALGRIVAGREGLDQRRPE